MKREIKFRGKRIDNGEWVYGTVYNANYADAVFDTYIIEQNQTVWFTSPDRKPCIAIEQQYAHKVDPATVGQLTGLIDKNGKEIYEGDIVTCVVNNEFRYRHKGVVEYQIGYIGFAVNVGKDPNSESDEDFFSPMYLNVEFEIIGNIH